MSKCIAFTYGGVRYPMPTGSIEEIPFEVRQDFAKKFYETDARLEAERQEANRSRVPR